MLASVREGHKIHVIVMFEPLCTSQWLRSPCIGVVGGRSSQIDRYFSARLRPIQMLLFRVFVTTKSSRLSQKWGVRNAPANLRQEWSTLQDSTSCMKELVRPAAWNQDV